MQLIIKSIGYVWFLSYKNNSYLENHDNLKTFYLLLLIFILSDYCLKPVCSQG